MHCWRSALLSAVLLTTAIPATSRVPDSDEAWIEGYMSQPGHSAGVADIRSGYRIGWPELSQFIGVRVKIETDTGRTHRGRIEKVDRNELLLRTELHGGYAELALRRDQIARTELE